MYRSITKDTILALQQGDPKAFEDVFLSFFNKIKYFITAYIKSDADAEELAEDIFVNLWINRLSIDPEKSFNSYMHTVARNTALNYLRHKHVKQTYEASYNLNEYGACPDEDLIAHETSLLIEMAVERMPEQRKKIFKLSKQQGLKNDEIAILLNTSKRNVESQLSLALKEIREAISVILFFIA